MLPNKRNSENVTTKYNLFPLFRSLFKLAKCKRTSPSHSGKFVYGLGIRCRDELLNSARRGEGIAAMISNALTNLKMEDGWRKMCFREKFKNTNRKGREAGRKGQVEEDKTHAICGKSPPILTLA